MRILQFLFAAAKSNLPIGESVVLTSFAYANLAQPPEKFPFSTATAKSTGKKTTAHMLTCEHWALHRAHISYLQIIGKQQKNNAMRTFLRAPPTRRVLTTWTRTDSSRYNRFTISWAHKLNDSTHCSFRLLPRARVRRSASLGCKPMSYVCHIMSCACVNDFFFIILFFIFFFLWQDVDVQRVLLVLQLVSETNEWICFVSAAVRVSHVCSLLGCVELRPMWISLARKCKYKMEKWGKITTAIV